MSQTTDLILTCGDYELTYTTGNDLQDAIQEFFDDNSESDDDPKPTPEQLDPANWIVTDWGDVANCDSLQDIDILNEIADAKDMPVDWGIIDAAVYCGIAIDDIGEAYFGKYDNDEDFSYEMAEQVGDLDKNPHWPYTCIDWKKAARDLMYDYCDHNGYYFRNL